MRTTRRTPRRLSWRARSVVRRQHTASTRSGPASAMTTGRTGTPNTWSRADRQTAADMSNDTTSSSSAAARPASTAPVRSRRAVCASPSSNASWSAASAHTGPASRRRRCCARGGRARANDAAAPALVDVEAALAWRDYMVSNYSDAGQERWLAEKGIDLLPRSRSPGRNRRGRGRRRPPHGRARRLATGSEPIIPPVPGLGVSMESGPTAKRPA